MSKSKHRNTEVLEVVWNPEMGEKVVSTLNTIRDFLVGAALVAHQFAAVVDEIASEMDEARQEGK